MTIGLTARQIEEECDKSLRRLGVDTIDLYYAHVDDRNTPLEESLAAFDRLVQAGKVRFIGASNFLAWRLAQAHALSVANGWPDYCCIQQRYTYLRPKPGASFDPQIAVNDDLLDYCRNNPVTLLAYSSLLAGAYTRPDRSIGEQYLGPDGDARLAALQQVAAAHGVSANQVILAWMMQSDPLVVPVMAAGSETQMSRKPGGAGPGAQPRRDEPADQRQGIGRNSQWASCRDAFRSSPPRSPRKGPSTRRACAPRSST